MPAVAVWAQADDWSVRPQHSLSVSLNGLKQSAERMRQRNAWLATEIQILEMKLEGSASAPAVPQRPQAVGRYAPKNPGPAAQAGVLTPAGPEIMSAAKEQRLLQEIGVLEQDIQALNAALQGTEMPQDSVAPSEGQEQRLSQARNSIKQLGKQLQDFERGNSSAWDEFNRLQTANLQLKAKRAELDGRFQEGTNEADRLTKELETLDQRLAQEIEQEQSAVADFSASKERLDSVLKKADMRMEGRKQRLQISDQELEVLMENRHFIQAENTSLKEQFSRLQEDWKEIQKSAKK